MPEGEVELEYEFGENKELKITAVSPDYEPEREEGLPSEGFLVGAAENGQRWETKILTINNWPEFKTKTCSKKVEIPLDGWTTVSYPCLWRRTNAHAWFLTIVYSGSADLPRDIEKTIQECAKIASVPAVPLLLTGNPCAAAATVLEAFKTCLVSKGIQEISELAVGFDCRATCGPWKRV